MTDATDTRAMTAIETYAERRLEGATFAGAMRVAASASRLGIADTHRTIRESAFRRREISDRTAAALRSRVREVRDGGPDARALATGPSAGGAMCGYIRGAGRGDRTLAEAAGCYGSAPGVAGICPCELPRRNLHTQSGDPVLSRLALDLPDGAHARSGRRSARSAPRSPGG